MKKQLLVLAALAAMSSSSVSAKEISGVEIPETISPEQQVLHFNGAGVRSKFFVDLYVGSLFTTAKMDSATKVMEGDQPAAIRLNITSGMITSEKMTKAMIEGFERATHGDVSPIEGSIKDFMSAFSEPIVEGDQFTLLSIPGKGVVTFKNGKQQSVTQGDTFRKALLGVWLGDDPTDDDLKEDMLHAD